MIYFTVGHLTAHVTVSERSTETTRVPGQHVNSGTQNSRPCPERGHQDD